jgi:hypothetical protein
VYDELKPGTVLQGRYRILEDLSAETEDLDAETSGRAAVVGRGGMGAVYRATDERLGTIVALKETFFGERSPTMRQAFEDEARLLARLHHPALPVVHDHFVEGNGQFLVMQFVDGEDLLAQLERRGGQPFSVDDVLAWADQLLDALEYLHEHHVIHRDIKPQNLKVTPQGKLYLLDFGLAKDTPPGETASAIAGYGTRHYAPLEQELGAGTDARSDLYSVAATLYHLLTGVPPPDAARDRSEAQRRGQPDPLEPVRRRNPEVPSQAAATLQRALALAPEQRPASATEMRRALRPPPPEREPGSGLGNRTGLLAGGGVVAALVVVGFASGIIPGPRPGPTPTATAIPARTATPVPGSPAGLATLARTTPCSVNPFQIGCPDPATATPAAGIPVRTPTLDLSSILFRTPTALECILNPQRLGCWPSFGSSTLTPEPATPGRTP